MVKPIVRATLIIALLIILAFQSYYCFLLSILLERNLEVFNTKSLERKKIISRSFPLNIPPFFIKLHSNRKQPRVINSYYLQAWAKPGQSLSGSFQPTTAISSQNLNQGSDGRHSMKQTQGLIFIKRSRYWGNQKYGVNVLVPMK